MPWPFGEATVAVQNLTGVLVLRLKPKVSSNLRPLSVQFTSTLSTQLGTWMSTSLSDNAGLTSSCRVWCHVTDADGILLAFGNYPARTLVQSSCFRWILVPSCCLRCAWSVSLSPLWMNSRGEDTTSWRRQGSAVPICYEMLDKDFNTESAKNTPTTPTHVSAEPRESGWNHTAGPLPPPWALS